tara:strand:+ start:9691 stop:11034 length:1344 start_codon:yes stop_codon:yes gene_type:complete
MKKLFLLLPLIFNSQISAQSQNATITLYRDGYGLVKQPVSFTVEKGRNEVNYSSLPNQMEVESPFLSLNKAKMLFQRFNKDVFHSRSFLQEQLGYYITVTTDDGETFKGQLLAMENNWLSIEQKKTITMINFDEIISIQVGSKEKTYPVKEEMSWEISSKVTGNVTGELIYITRGIEWDASYRLISSNDKSTGNLISQANIKNETNLSFTHASTQLLEGNLKRAKGGGQRRVKTQRGGYIADMAADVSPEFSAEELGDYHLYTLSEKLTLPKNEMVTVSLYKDKEVKFTRLYKFENNERSKKKEPLVVELSFTNDSEKPFPAGNFQIYHKNTRGNVEFAGEDMLKYVPKGEIAKVIAGRASDVLGERKVVNYERKKKSEEASILLEVKNKRNKQVEVELTEHIHGDWVIKEPSHNYKKVDASTITFNLTLKPNSTETVTYTYRKEWQ